MRMSRSQLLGSNKRLLIWVLLLLVGIGIGVYGAFRLATRQEGGSLPWGLLVPSYVFFALSATGSSLVNSFFTVFQVEGFKPIVKRGVLLSLILVVPAMIFIIMDLGRWQHAYNLYLLFQSSSRLAWMGLFYMLFVICLVVELVVIIREEHMPKWAPRVMGAVVLLVTLATHTNLGALFGSVTARPLWSSFTLPVHFLITAVMVGAALQILFMSVTYLIKRKNALSGLKAIFSWGHRPLMLWLIIINFALIAIEFIPKMLSPEESPYVKVLLTGEYGFLFWGMEILVGGIIPFAILLYHKTRQSTPWLLAASAMVVIGVYFSKYDLVIAGQSIGPLFTTNFIPYIPSMDDILLLIGGIAACLLVYTLGDLLLPLEEGEKPDWFIFTKKGLSLKQGATE